MADEKSTAEGAIVSQVVPQPPTNLPNHRVPEAADYELKKQYLALLPTEQIIEICLKLDMFAVSYIRSTIWPMDLNGAIDSLKKSSSSTAKSNSPVSTSTTTTAATTNTLIPHATTVDAAHRPPEVPGPSPSPSTHQRQGYPYSSSQPYPHTPYYTGGPAPGFSYSPYQTHVPGYSPSSAAAGGAPPAPPVQHQDYHVHAASTPDDLPSYEEMIVQALQSMPTPEGVAPKDLFTWMAAHYPLQANFRPSASQALQKAFKRGRFEKTPAGKYKLNVHWDGPVSTKRTTRRPQTVPHQHIQFHRLPGVPLPPPQPPHLAHQGNVVVVHHNDPQHNPPNQPQTQTLDAYQAARNILSALSSGDLLDSTPQTAHPSDETKKPIQGSTSNTSSSHFVSPQPQPPPPATGSNPAPTSLSSSPQFSGARIELQSQLALLATQLIDYARGTVDTQPEGDARGANSILTVDAPPAAAGSVQRDGSTTDDDDDMQRTV